MSAQALFLWSFSALVLWLVVLLILGRARDMPRANPAPDASEMISVEVIITLVHGTAGWFSSWLRDRSKLRDSLSAVFDQKVAFCRVRWSGLNSFRARRNGAAELRRQVMDNSLKWPDARQVIIAHSHGGSVALEALIDSECAKRVDGLVCMATPFLVFTRYRLPTMSRNLRDFSDLVGAGAFIALVCTLAWSILPTTLVDALASGVAAFNSTVMPAPDEFLVPSFKKFGVFLAVLAIPSGFVYLLLWGARRMGTHYEHVVTDALAETVFPASKVLILRQPGDEAGGAIAGLHAATWPLGMLLRLIGMSITPFDGAHRRARGSRWGKLWRGGSGMAIACTAIAAVMLATAPANIHSLPGGLGLLTRLVDLVGSALLIAMWAAYLLAAIASGLLGVVLLLHFVSLLPAIIAVGPEMFFAGSRLRVTAEPTPVGKWTVVGVPMDADLIRRRPLVGALWHSYLYESDAAIAELAAWLKVWRG